MKFLLCWLRFMKNTLKLLIHRSSSKNPHIFSYILILILSQGTVRLLAQQATSNNKVSSAQNALIQSLELSKNKKYSEALKILDENIKTTPKDPALVAAKADVFTNMGNEKESIEFAKQAEILSPTYDWPKIILINNYLKLKKYDSALKKINELKTIGKELQHYSIKGRYYLDLKTYDKANQAFAKAAKIQDSPGLREIKAWNFNLWGYPKENMAEIDKGLELDPNNTRLLIAKSTSFKKRKIYKPALQTLAQTITTCETQNSCIELESDGIQKFFFTDDIKGDYMGSTTNAYFFSSEYRQNLFQTENILRSLKAGQVDATTSNQLFAMGYNPTIYGDIGFSDVSRTRNIKNYLLSYERALDAQSQFALRQRVSFEASFQKNYLSAGFGDMILKPYLIADYQEGNTGSISNPAIQGSFRVVSMDIGAHLYASPNFYKTSQRLKVGATVGKNLETKNHFGLVVLEYEAQRHFSLFSSSPILNNNFFSFLLQGIHTKEIEADFYDFRVKSQGDLKLKLYKYLSLQAKNETIAHWDHTPPKYPGVLTALNIFDASIQLEEVMLTPKLRFQRLHGITEDAYDHIQFAAELQLRLWAGLSRSMDKKNLNYRQPLTFHVGYERTQMLYEASEKGKEIDSFYGSIKVFK